MMHIGTLLTIYIIPFILTLTYYGRRMNRRMAEAERLCLPFDPKPIPAPTGIFRSLSAPQRVYLTQQFKLALGLYLLLAWTELFILSMQFLVPVGDSTPWFDPAARTWLLFLSNASRSETFFSVFLIFSVFAVIIPIRVGAQALFHRARPLSIGFLFWMRVLPILFALCTAMLTGIIFAFALLAIVKGPVWHNLPETIPRTLGPDDADVIRDYANLLLTSAPRIFLSLITTMTLFFSVLVAIFTIPSKRLITRSNMVVLLPLIFVLAIFGPILLIIFDDMPWLHLPRILFIYAHLGAPPPYAFALGPIVLSAALLLLARIFVRRIEL